MDFYWTKLVSYNLSLNRVTVDTDFPHRKCYESSSHAFQPIWSTLHCYRPKIVVPRSWLQKLSPWVLSISSTTFSLKSSTITISQWVGYAKPLFVTCKLVLWGTVPIWEIIKIFSLPHDRRHGNVSRQWWKKDLWHHYRNPEEQSSDGEMHQTQVCHRNS